MLSRFVLGTCVTAIAFAGSPARADDQVDCANFANARELAVAACDRLLASPELTDKERATAYENRAGAFAISNLDQAIADISEAIRLEPTRPGNFYVRGNHWTRKNDYHRAILDYNDAVRLNPRHTLALVARGENYEKLGELAKAFADYQTALDINPMDISASMRMSRLNARIPANSPMRRPVNVQDDENACRRGSLTARLRLYGPLTRALSGDACRPTCCARRQLG